jgi:hypothetical protein
MRQLVLISKIILTALLVLNIFIWIIAQGSGHNIPLRTNIIFGARGLVLLALLILLIYWGNKMEAKRR